MLFSSSFQCLCGLPDIFNLTSAVSSSSCNVSCTLDNKQLCGGLKSISMYRSSSVPYSPSTALETNLIRNPLFKDHVDFSHLLCSDVECEISKAASILPWFLTNGGTLQLIPFPGYKQNWFYLDLTSDKPYSCLL